MAGRGGKAGAGAAAAPPVLPAQFPFIERSPRRSLLLGAALAASLAVAAGPLAADQIVLRNGNILDGRVQRLEDGNFRIQVEEGNQVTVPAGEVLQWIPGTAPIDELENRLAGVDRGDRDALIELGAWAEERGLTRSAKEVFRLILEVDPHHAGARDRLGFVLHRNRWVPRAELEKKGLVRYRGAWMPPEEVSEIRRREAVDGFRALLADAHHDNRYLRENALYQLFALEDERLLPCLLETLRSADPLDRMIAARVLGNMDLEPGGDAVYRAYLLEMHPEVGEAMRAVLRSYGDARLGDWLARDMAAWNRTTERSPESLASLLALASLCPHRAIVPHLLGFVEVAELRVQAERTLAKFFGALPSEFRSWREFWQKLEPAAPIDLGSGWVRDQARERGAR